MTLSVFSLAHATIATACTFFFFFFNDTATTEIYTLSLHDALPISCRSAAHAPKGRAACRGFSACVSLDRKSTRLNSSHLGISYAVFCLKKKKNRLFLQTYDGHANTRIRQVI